MGKNILKMAALCLCMAGANGIYAADQGKSSAKQIVDKFQQELIAVMKNGKKLGYSGRFDKLKDPVNDSHDLGKIARIVVGKEWEKLSESQQQQLVRDRKFNRMSPSIARFWSYRSCLAR